MADDVLIELDDRRRVSLGKVGRVEHRRYLAHEETDGTVILRPAVLLTETELAVLADPELVRQIQEGLEDAPGVLVRGRGRPRRQS